MGMTYAWNPRTKPAGVGNSALTMPLEMYANATTVKCGGKACEVIGQMIMVAICWLLPTTLYEASDPMQDQKKQNEGYCAFKACMTARLVT